MSDLKNLRLKEERLKFKQDTTFKAMIASLAYVHELKLQQQELCKRGIEMLCYGLKTLNKLNEQENHEREEKERQEHPKPTFDIFFPPTSNLISAKLAVTLLAYDLANPFLATLGFSGGTP
jgi:hypothetical protein